jgi:hypothetical protein
MLFLMQDLVSVLQRHVTGSHVALGEMREQSFRQFMAEELNVLAEPFATLNVLSAQVMFFATGLTVPFVAFV